MTLQGLGEDAAGLRAFVASSFSLAVLLVLPRACPSVAGNSKQILVLIFWKIMLSVRHFLFLLSDMEIRIIQLEV